MQMSHNIPTMTYLPFCFFYILSPPLSLFIAAIGFKIFRKMEMREQCKRRL